MPSKEWEGVNAVLMLGKDEILYILTNKNSNLFVTVYNVVQNLWPWTEFLFHPKCWFVKYLFCI